MKQRFYIFKLRINEYSQCHYGFSRKIYPRFYIWMAFIDFSNYFSELTAGFDFFNFSGFDYGAGDLTRQPFVGERIKNIGKPLRAKSVNGISRRYIVGIRINAHI